MTEPKPVKIIDTDGTEYEVLRYALINFGDVYLGSTCTVLVSLGESGVYGLILRRIPKYHYFGPEGGVQIKLEETGETRLAKPGEGYLDRCGMPAFWCGGRESYTEYPILIPVAVIAPEEE